jgi:hypothetical protein
MIERSTAGHHANKITHSTGTAGSDAIDQAVRSAARLTITPAERR